MNRAMKRVFSILQIKDNVEIFIVKLLVQNMNDIDCIVDIGGLVKSKYENFVNNNISIN